jgi:histidyl-tRNA synthetase
MKQLKTDCYKGTRILVGNEKRNALNRCINVLTSTGFTEIQMPIIQFQETFKNKVGIENNNLMFNFTDRGNRNICLAPEYTAVIQRLSDELPLNYQLFYVQECFRGEKPQKGRYRQFTQLGVEIVNIYTSAESQYLEFLITLAVNLITNLGIPSKDLIINRDASRGLDYYKDGKGFEILYDKLGSSKQICGGGQYDKGIGFAIGVDRILSINE